ncbi:Uncharacterised protein [Serratia quinivorans]|nr:Uncharacterised protein [Serratia quinivorans]CAI2020676.1 Uncharacterised protein [Serratia quinivorans]CAI2159877.1 Uncharacterised protein [Serratia quinivorans]CAI2538765.1 Uncharacterised protein [Serratia quinivorans]
MSAEQVNPALLLPLASCHSVESPEALTLNARFSTLRRKASSGASERKSRAVSSAENCWPFSGGVLNSVLNKPFSPLNAWSLMVPLHNTSDRATSS